MKNRIIYPHRGNPPAVPVGYERDPGDPYVMNKIWLECIDRTTLTPCKGCPNSGTVPYCNQYDKPVEQSECNACTSRKIPHQIDESIEESIHELPHD